MLIMRPPILWTATIRHYNVGFTQTETHTLTQVTVFATNFVGVQTASFDYRCPARPNQHTCYTNPSFHVLTRCKAFTHDAWEDLCVFFCIIPFKAHFRCVYPLSSYCWGQWATERLSYGRAQWASFEQAIDWTAGSELHLEWTGLVWKWHGRAWHAQRTWKAK